MNIFDQYGIKEVADVTLYSIELDENDDEIYVPVIYLDTLKISTVEQTADQVSARGGLGNAELVIWDFGKEITVTLQDALYSPASQGMMWGGKYGTQHIKIYGTLTDRRTGEPTDATLEVESYNTFTNQSDMFIWGGAKYKIVGKNYKRCRMEGQLCYNYKTEEWGLNASGSQTGALTMTDTISNANYIFTVIPEMNYNVVPPQECIYQIDHSLNNVFYLDRMEKCKATQTFVINTDNNTTHGNYRFLEKYAECELTCYIDPKTMMPYEPNTDEFTRKNGSIITGNLRVIKQYEIYYKWTRSKAIEGTSLGHQIIVDATHFSGAYRLVGETYSRSRGTGKDQRFQIEIPLCKMGNEHNITLEAEGEPTTFDMTLKVLRKDDGTMIKLTQYNVEESKYDGYASGSTKVTPIAEVMPSDPTTGSD